jgi:hypothetical protein
MRSQEWKLVNIKSPILRRVRTSLRIVLKETVQAELRRLNRLQRIYIQKRVNQKITPSQKRRKAYLTKQSNKLLQAETNSILNCGNGATCVSIKDNQLSPDIATLGEDMVWNPILRKWFCVNCYNLFFKTEAQKVSLRKMLESREKKEEAFDKWFSEQIKPN